MRAESLRYRFNRLSDKFVAFQRGGKLRFPTEPDYFPEAAKLNRTVRRSR